MRKHLLFSATLIASCATAAQAQWVTFNNETTTRMPVGPGLNTAATSTTDPDEKDYAWGDVDQDGDIDLVCVRKQPFTTSGRRPNVLFMNEGIAQGHSVNGVLVDRTALYAIAVDMNGDGETDPQPASDLGFQTATNDRDVVLADVNNDGWLDIITATTLSEGQPKVIGHPRVYMNLGSNKSAWLGFRHEPSRIPQMHATVQPRFCSVAAGDVTGDGYVDLYFGDYDSGGSESFDYNNKLLINGGASNPGVFTDSGTTRMSANPGLLSAFGAASVIADMNNDGALDVVKQTSLNSPLHVAVQHNNPNDVGNFSDSGYFIAVPSEAPYFVSVGDLNNDNRLDMVTTDDGADRYRLNTGNSANGNSTYQAFTFQPSGVDDGFGSQSVVDDLNNDGWNDVLIADVDVDISGCSRRMHIYRNLGNAPNVTLTQQAMGTLPPGTAFPNSALVGTHNVAVFDLDGDGWKDLIIGRCSGTAVWMNVPPAGIAFSYPEGLPGYLSPDETTSFDVQLAGISGAAIVANSGKQYVSIDGGPFSESFMTPLGGNLYSATIPAVDCTSRVRYYFSGQLVTGGTVIFDPPTAPANNYLTLAAIGTEITVDDTIEGDVSDWTVSNGAGLTAGTWEQADPNATFFNAALASPEDDATGGAEFLNGFVTLNGAAGGAAGASDVDGGATYLVSPALDLAGADATISYSRWFFASLAGNLLTTEVSNNNGSTWVPVDSVNATINDNGETVWETRSFVVGSYVTPTSEVRVRFTANGPVAAAVVEAGIDNFRVEEVVCGLPCVADVVNAGASAGVVDIDDLLAVIGAWGDCPTPPAACPANVATSGASATVVDIDDLLAVIGAWGACP